MKRAALFLALCLACAAGGGAGLAAQGTQGAQGAAGIQGALPTEVGGMKVRYGVAATPAELAALARSGKAESFSVDMVQGKDAATGETRVLGDGEAHGLYRGVSAERAFAVVVDYPNLRAISPRMLQSRIIDSSTPGRWLVYEDVGINFMGIYMGYRLDVESFRDELPGGAIGLRARMAKSHDGRLYVSDSSWYFAPLKVGGEEYLYIRTWSASGLRNPGFGVAGIMKMFTAGELKDQVNAVARIAAVPKP